TYKIQLIYLYALHLIERPVEQTMSSNNRLNNKYRRTIGSTTSKYTI
ncbi:unnamed protein product, partial [Rotaria magnacalcarata]